MIIKPISLKEQYRVSQYSELNKNDPDRLILSVFSLRGDAFYYSFRYYVAHYLVDNLPTIEVTTILGPDAQVRRYVNKLKTWTLPTSTITCEF